MPACSFKMHKYVFIPLVKHYIYSFFQFIYSFKVYVNIMLYCVGVFYPFAVELFILLTSTEKDKSIELMKLIGLKQNVSVFFLAELTKLTCSAGNVNN